MRSRIALALLLPLWLVGLGTGCRTTVGNYFAKRARDLGDCFLAQAGLGVGLGVDVKAGGLLHADALFSIYFEGGSVGWVYGAPRPAARVGYFGHSPAEGDVGVVVFHGSFRSFGGTEAGHLCFGILPAVLSWENGV